MWKVLLSVSPSTSVCVVGAPRMPLDCGALVVTRAGAPGRWTHHSNMSALTCHLFGPVRRPSGPTAPPHSAGSRSGHGQSTGPAGSTDGGVKVAAGTGGPTTTG